MQRRTLLKLELTSAAVLMVTGGWVTALICQNIEQNRALAQAGRVQVAIKIIAKHYLLAGVAINSPAVEMSSSVFEQKVEAGTEAQDVTRPDGVHWQLENLSIHDGSLFPASIGANPQLSVYGAVNRIAQGLAKKLTGRDVTLA